MVKLFEKMYSRYSTAYTKGLMRSLEQIIRS